MITEVDTELDLQVKITHQMSDVFLVSYLHFLFPILHWLPTDFEGCREDLHDLLCVGHLCGLVLPGESDLGCGRHGLRGAESGHYGRGRSKRGGIQGHAGAAQETAGRCTSQSPFMTEHENDPLVMLL